MPDDDRIPQVIPELTREPVYRHWSYDQLYDERLRLEAECDRLATELRVEREEHQHTRNTLGAEVERINNERVRQTAKIEFLRRQVEREETEAGEWHDKYVLGTERISELSAEVEQLRAENAELYEKLEIMRRHRASEPDPPTVIRFAHEQRDRALAEARDAEARLRDAVVLTREEREAIDGVLLTAAAGWEDGLAEAVVEWELAGKPLLGGGEEPGE